MESPREEMKGNSESQQQQPWLLITDPRRNYCHLQNCMFHDYDVGGEIPEIVGRTPQCSYGEWVVLDGSHHDDVLVNLFSKETIQLPVMAFASDLCVLTSPPSDPTCHLVYFSFHDDEESNSLIIWQPGDKEFTIKKWDCEIIPDQVRAYAVMAGELCLDILSRDGESVSVMVEFKESTYQCEVVQMDEGEIEFMNSSYDTRFFEYSGELFAVYMIRCGGDTSNVAGFKIFKADLLNKKWIRIKNLGGLAIFIGCSTFQTHCAAVDDSGIAGNSIYFLEHKYHLDRDSYYVYNLEEGTVRMQPIFCSMGIARVDWITVQGDPPFPKLLKEDQEIISEVGNGEVEQDEVQESWNMVPHELLNLIQLLLFGRDYAVFPGVCKAWQQASIQWKQTSIQDYSLLSSATLLEQCQSSSPLLMYQEDITSSCVPIFRFFDPVHRKLYRTRIPELKEVDIQYSRDGWLLVLRSSDQSVFFFNPLTQEKIELPRMPPHESYKDFLSFSSPPTCSNCLVVGMEYYQDTIYTLKHGDGTWRKYDLNYVMRDRCNVVMLDGLHYFLYEDRYMLVLNLNGAEGQEEEVLDGECWSPKLGRSKSLFEEDFFLEIDGAVAFVTVQPNRGGISIFKWNDLKTDWELMEGGAEFGGKQMFLSRRGSFMEKMDDIGGLGNTIFLPMIDDAKAGIFYSLATEKYHTFYTGYSSELPYNVDKFLDGIWVKPDKKIVGQNNLKWFIS